MCFASFFVFYVAVAVAVVVGVAVSWLSGCQQFLKIVTLTSPHVLIRGNQT